MKRFSWLAEKIVKNRWIVISVWIAVSAILLILAPPLSSLTSYELQKFLPPGTDSLRATKLLEQYFPDEKAESSVVVVLTGDRQRVKEVSEPYFKSLSEWLKGSLGPKNVVNILSAYERPELADRFRSKDGEAEFILVNLDDGFVAPETLITVDQISSHLNPPKGVDVKMTGDAVLGRDYNTSIQVSIERSTVITIVLVVLLLLFIYRSPVTPLISLFPVGIAFIVSLSVLSLIALSGVSLPDTLNIFLVVLIFGAGTDYCVFLIGRFREEFIKTQDPKVAAVNATIYVGEAITSSAATIMVGLSAMALAKFGAINTVGPSLALSIFITLIAAITLVPSILSIVGKWALWPHTFTEKISGSSMLEKLAKIVTASPRKALLIGLMLPLPLIYLATKMVRSYDLFKELPENSWSLVGFRELEKHFPPGEIAPAVIFVSTNEDISSPATFDDLYKLTKVIQESKGVSLVFAPSQPLGDPSMTRQLAIPEQLNLIVDGLDKVHVGLERELDGMQKIRGGVGQFSEGIEKKYKNGIPIIKELAAKDVQVAQDGLGRLDDGVQSLEDGIVKIRGGIERIEDVLKGYKETAKEQPHYLDSLYLPPDVLKNNKDLKIVFDTFVSQNGRGARLVALQKDPLYSFEALDSIDNLRRRLENFQDITPTSIKEVHLSGANALMADIRDITIEDQKRIVIASLIGIFLILLFLFKGLWIPTYLLLTMLFNYLITMGLTVLLFQYLLDIHGLDWKVAFLSFVLLVALGIDYTILILYRIRQEQKKYEPKEAIHRALSKSGGSIIACGLILAGTISSLMFTPLQLMQQIGFSVATGLLLVTFIVVTILVPSIALLTEEWRERHAAKLVDEMKHRLSGEGMEEHQAKNEIANRLIR